jgi:hypothetical protein
MYTNYITSIFATETHIQEKVKSKPKSEHSADFQSAFICLRVTDEITFLAQREARQSA